MSEQDFDSVPTRIIHPKKKEDRDSQPIQVSKPRPKPKGKNWLPKFLPQAKEKSESKTALTTVIEKDQPHDSAYTHSALKERHTLGVLPTLNTDDRGKYGWLVPVALCMMCFFAAWGTAYEIQIAITSHVQGTCPSPAVIEKGGCFNVESSTAANGNTVTTLIPGGHLSG